MPAPPTEAELRLARKLAETLHLHVEDRAALPGGVVRLSAVVAAIDVALREAPFFPPRVRGPDDSYTGVALERRPDGSVWTHERHEVGVGRLSAARSEPAASLPAAVERYFHALGGYSVDGVRVDEGA